MSPSTARSLARRYAPKVMAEASLYFTNGSELEFRLIGSASRKQADPFFSCEPTNGQLKLRRIMWPQRVGLPSQVSPHSFRHDAVIPGINTLTTTDQTARQTSDAARKCVQSISSLHLS